MSDTRPWDIEADMAAIAESRRVRLKTDPDADLTREERLTLELSRRGDTIRFLRITLASIAQGREDAAIYARAALEETEHD